MQTEFFIRGLSERYVRFVLEKVLKKKVYCVATAKRNLTGNKVNIFDKEFTTPISIKKGQKFLVVSGSEYDYGMLKRVFPFAANVYQAEDIFCQTKWKRQPYKFFFKDTQIAN